MRQQTRDGSRPAQIENIRRQSLLIVAILVKIKMPGGPAFFVQKRVGKDGKLFSCHKFRTMTVKHNGSTVSVAGDSRITPFGAELRHWKLDELPGLWDVLIGNMSFVGPRPDVPGYADKLKGDDRDVLSKRKKITCFILEAHLCGYR